MIAVKPKLMASHFRGFAETETRARIVVRDLEIVADEPLDRGGTNRGGAPTDLLIAALIGCSNVMVHRLAARAGVSVHHLAIDAESHFDWRGAALIEEVAVPMPNITLRVQLAADGDEAAIRSLQSDLGRFCPIAKILRAAGTEIEEVWTVARAG